MGEAKRSKWEADAAALAAKVGGEQAAKEVAAKAKKIGVSLCAEARMKEAVEETLDGSRLPAPPPQTLLAAHSPATASQSPKSISSASKAADSLPPKQRVSQ